MTKPQVNIRQLESKARPTRGFKPKFWLQIMYTDDPELFQGYNGGFADVEALAIALTQVENIERVLFISGKANKQAVKMSETIAEYTRFRSDRVEQKVIQIGAIA